jgi:hypothetical protein
MVRACNSGEPQPDFTVHAEKNDEQWPVELRSGDQERGLNNESFEQRY